jgi:hypothetical protein
VLLTPLSVKLCGEIIVQIGDKWTVTQEYVNWHILENGYCYLETGDICIIEKINRISYFVRCPNVAFSWIPKEFVDAKC